MIRVEVDAMLQAHTNSKTSERDNEALREAISSILPVADDLAQSLRQAHDTEVTDLVMAEATALYEQRVNEFLPGAMRMVERFTYINALDRLWIEHLEAMDSLRGGIGLRAIGQRDPLVEYKREGFRVFKQLIALLDADVATTIFKVTVQTDAPAVSAPVETALTRAAELASTNVGVDGIQAPATGESRQERRAKVRAVGKPSATKKHKKRR